MPCADPIAPDDFLGLVQPLLETSDIDGLLTLLRSHWTGAQLCDLLTNDSLDARKVAALALALVGDKRCIGRLVEKLQDPDPMINQMAEHALWSIWLRGGAGDANQHLCRGADALERRDVAAAIGHFDKAIAADPDFAEAYNQRAIARYLTERYEQCIEDCRRATNLMPCHFGAWAGMGHCHAHLGRLDHAVRCYERAMAINPHLRDIARTVKELRAGRAGGSTAAT